MGRFEGRVAFEQGVPFDGFPLDYIATLIGPQAAETAFRSFGNGARKGGPRTLGFIPTWKVMAAHVQAVRDESHGAAQPGAPIGNFELMCGTMIQGRNLADGLARMARFASVMKTDMQVETRMVRGRLHVSGVSRSPFSDARETYTDGFALVLHMVVRWTLGLPARVVKIRCSEHLAPRYGTSLGLFCSNIEWRGEGFTLVYDEEAARAPFATGDVAGWVDGAYREFLKVLAQWREPDALPLESGVAERVRRYLIDRPAGQAKVAKALGMSVATLRRRLAHEGKSFRAISSSVRRDAAEMLLGTERSSHEIAADLGLSDSRCFRRACQSWFGRSPSEVRNALLTAMPMEKSPLGRSR